MFGLFNKSEKISNEIATALTQTLRVSLYASKPERMNLEGNIDVPYGFWADEYVQGFFLSLSSLFLEKLYDGTSMNQAKKGEILVLVFDKVCGHDAIELLNRLKTEARGERSSEFNRGQNDSATLFGATFGILNPDDKDPILLEAKNMAEGVYEVHLDIAKSLERVPSSSGALANAVSELTIVQHIKNNF